MGAVMFDDDSPPPTLAATQEALGGVVRQTHTTVAGYFAPIFFAFLVCAGAGYLLYLSYNLGEGKSTVEVVFRQQMFKLSLIGGPVLLTIIFWYWRKLRRKVYLCAQGLVELTPRALRGVRWENVSHLEVVTVQRRWLRGPLGLLFALQDNAFLVHVAGTPPASPDPIVIDRWAFADATNFFQQVINAAVERGIPVQLNISKT